ncbi:MAG TPA: 3-phosphoshikimate 1-carboxyvinyltransferase [Candidatus Methylacidiphilales bacterium]
MNHLRIIPAPKIDGEIAVPGDKSISHRSVIFGSLASGPTRVTGFLPGEDCMCTLRALQAMGAQIEVIDETTLLIEGIQGKFKEPYEALDCGNSGTGMRLLAGLLAGQPFKSKLFGDASLSRRPMKRIMDPLGLMGAKIKAEGEKNTPPLSIEGTQLAGIDYKSPVASAQVKSCTLIAGLLAQGVTRVTEPIQSRDHTEKLLAHFYAAPQVDGLTVTVRGGTKLHGNDLQVPGDFSSAAFWLVAAAATPGSRLVIRNVGLNPTRTGLLNVLIRMGAQIREHVEAPSAEPYGTLEVIGTKLHGVEIGGSEIPNIIDEIPIISVAAALAEGQTIIRDAHELRVKESDRIKSMATNLREFGVPVVEQPDGMIVEGGYPIKHARVESFGDHRIAMACAILALSADHPSRIDDTDCIATSYPGFFRDLEYLTQKYAQSLPERTWHALKRKISPPKPPVRPEEGTSPNHVIAIDGPAASGKSTVARELAKRLGFAYVNTGTLYRAVTWKLLDEKVDLSRPNLVAERLKTLQIECRIEADALAIRLDGVDPLPHLRDEAINQSVSPVAAIPAVRQALLEKQRDLLESGPLVVEGRDIGTVVFPQTPFKFFIDADPEVRAQRRAAQGEADAVASRDAQDAARKTAPLAKAKDAVTVDTSSLTVEQVIERVLGFLEGKGLFENAENAEASASPSK